MKNSVFSAIAACLFAAAAVSAQNPSISYGEKFADVDYVGDGKVYHKLDIYLPAEEKESYPVAIHVYGSAWSVNNGKGSADLGTICAALVDAGYAVAVPNHRSSSDAIYPAQLHDLKAAVRFLRGNASLYRLDTGFVAISGFSSGAHLAGLVATTCGLAEGRSGSVTVDLVGDLGDYTGYSSCVDAAALWSPPTNIYSMTPISISGSGTFEGAFIGVEREGNKDKYMVASSPFYASEDDPPIVMFHGDGDQIVNKEQSQELYDSLVAHGVETAELVYVANGAHGGTEMYSTENLGKMTAFFDDVLAAKSAVDTASQDSANAVGAARFAPGFAPESYSVYALNGTLVADSPVLDGRNLKPGLYVVVARDRRGEQRVFRYVKK